MYKKQKCPVCKKEANFLLFFDWDDDGEWVMEWGGDLKADINYMRKDTGRDHPEFLICSECGVVLS